ncbi:hypothetical protein AALP_AA8G502700 [Arabis alpina]|uniref:SCP domain-containing protein n=1 Tax=Arabis alpina TaxID=50452 RepID=A0A087GEN4_ARAAL|nr:hypothetical protein AALP_AA8G502700 [Arabis alpina]
MAITHHIIILVPLLVISTVVSAVSKPAETPAISVAAKAFTEAHNKARAMVGVSPLVWNQTLETAAYWLARYQGEVEKCEVTSFNPRKYGTNQLWTKGLALTPSLAVKAWVNEKAFYDYKSNTCAPKHTCGVYKRVVWRGTKELGCAQAMCAKESALLTICFYYPAGNVIGQKPY